MPNATNNAAYSQQILATGGTPPYTFRIIGGGLPNGLSMSEAGLISGIPNADVRRQPFWLSVTDAPAVRTDEALAIYVVGVPPMLPSVSPHGGMFDDCTLGVPCGAGLYVGNGGRPPLTWSATELPPGFSIRSCTAVSIACNTPGDGEIVGTGTAVGTHQVRVTVTDADGASATNIFPLRISPLRLRNEPTGGTVGESFSAKLHVVGGTAPHSGTVTAGPLPPGLTFNPVTQTVSGMPIETGGWHVDFSFTDANGNTLTTGLWFGIGGGTSTVNVNDYWDLGQTATGGFYSRQLSACCAPGGVTWSLFGGTPPPGLALSPDGVLSGTATTSGTYTFLVRAAEIGNLTNVGVRQLTLTVTPLALSMSGILSTGFTMTPYAVTLTTTGGSGAVTWAVAQFSYLPPGLTLTPNGLLSGTPTGSGKFDFNLIATDGASNTLTPGFSVSIYPNGTFPPLAITTSSDLGTWSVGEVQFQLTASGGNGTYAWELVNDNTLPPGISLRTDVPPWFGSASAGLMGVATGPGGPYTFTLRVTSGGQTDERTVTVTVTSLRTGDNFGLPDASVGQPYTYALRAEGVTGTATWTANPGSWLQLSPGGLLTGTPTAPGWYTIPFQLSDSTGTINSGVGVNVYGLHITSSILTNGTQNASYTAQVEVTGGTGPYTFTLQGGLPNGLSMNEHGAISGTCNTGPGRYGFDVTVTDALGSHRKSLAIYVAGTPASLLSVHEHGMGPDDCTVFVPCQRGFWVNNGGVAPFVWTASGLPAGLSMGNAISWTPGDGAIMGTPTEAGTFPITVTVTDSTGASATSAFMFTVSPLVLRFDNIGGTLGVPFSTRLRAFGGRAPYTGEILTGYLPTGLTFNGATGVISGTPLEPSGSHMVFRVTDADGKAATAGWGWWSTFPGPTGLTINSGPDLGYVTVGSSYSNQLSACCAASLTWSANPADLPPGMSLSSTGQLSGTATTAGTYMFRVSVADGASPTNVIVREFTLRVTPLSVSSTGAPGWGNVGTSYSAALTATGATGAVTWSVEPFTHLPPGLALVESGGAWSLSGSPKATGQFWFSLIATDGGTPSHSARLGLSVAVYLNGETPPVSITTAPDLGTWSVGEVQFQLTASGGNGTYTWELVDGSTLPPGVALRADVPPWFGSASAGLMGVATGPGGPYTFTLRVTSGSQTNERTFTVKVTTLRTGDNFGLPDASVGQPYTYALRAEGVTGTAVWTANPGVASWATLGPDGVVTGTPTAPGWYTIPFQLSDSTGAINSGVGVNVWGLHITSSILTNGTQNASYTAQVEVTGGTGPYTFTLQGGLPNGLSMDEHGAISGTCNTGPGRYGFDVTVTDALGSHRKSLAIYVAGTPASLLSVHEHGMGPDDCTVFVPCQRGFWVNNGGVAPFTWSATDLPAGLSMGNAISWTPGDGAIMGTPTEAGTFPITVTVTDSTGASATSAFTLTVSPMALHLDNTGGTLGVPFSTRLRVVGGRAPYTGKILTGYLPTGLTFDGATGVISGTPLEPSGSHIVFQFTDADRKTITAGWGWWTSFPSPTGLTINSGPDLGYVTVGSSYSNQLSACCTPSLTWALADGSVLPLGMSLSSTGQLSGTATTAGTHVFRVSVAEAATPLNVIVREFTLRVTPLSVSSTGNPAWTNVGTGYNVALSATGGFGGVTWSVAPFNRLPPGIGLVESGGVWTLAGTPTTSGQYNFTLTATDTQGHAAQLGFGVSIYPNGVLPPVRITQSPGTITRSIGDIEEPLVATGGDGINYTWEVLSGTLPPGLALRVRPEIGPWYSSNTGAEIAGVATAAGTYTFTLRVTSGSTHADQTCVITVTLLRSTDQYTLPDAFVGQPYTYSLGVAGNAGPVTFTPNNPNAQLPPGLSMDAAGQITGTPTTSGYYYADFSMNDGTDSVGRRLNLSVFDLRFTTPDQLPNGQQYTEYSTVIAAAGGTPPYTFTSGGLPNWGLALVALDNTRATITGTPTSPGNRGFNITVTDANNVSYTRRMAIDVVGDPKTLPSISPYGNGWNDCTYGFPCRLSISVSNGGTAPFSWSATGLPAGLSIGPGFYNSNNGITPGDGDIIGVPVEIGTFDVTVTVTDFEGVQATNTFPLRVSRLYARDFDGTGTRGELFATPGRYRRIRVIGGDASVTPTYTAAIISGQLPAGLSLDPHTREVSGTPIENGSFGITLNVTDDANPANALRTGQGLQIGGGTTTPGINSWDLGWATIGQSFSPQLSACCSPDGFVWSVDDGALPAGLQLVQAGSVWRVSGTVSSSNVPGVSTFRLRATDAGNPLNYGVRQMTLRLTSLAITTVSPLSVGHVDTTYTQTLTATGGSGALTWTLASGSYLPPGITMSTDGVLSGTPTHTGQFSFIVQAADAAGSLATRTLTLSLYRPGEVPPLGFTIGTTNSSQLGVYTLSLSASSISGGVGPYMFSLTPLAEEIPGMRVQNGPPLPASFSPSATAGYMGVITEPGLYHTSIRVTDSRGVTADRAITVTVQPITILSNPTPPGATLGVPYFFEMEPYGGSGIYSWSATNLPPGLSIDATTGRIAGTPTAFGPYSPNVTITDLTTSASNSMGFTLAVAPYSIETNGMLPVATVGTPYSVTLSASGCGAPCTWSVINSSLPGSLPLDTATGVISGNPSGPDHRSVTIRVSGSNGTAQRVFSLSILNAASPTLTISSSVAPGDVTVGSVTSLGLYSTGGTPPYTWTLDSGVLPPGVTLVDSAENYSANYGTGMYYLRGRAMEVGLYTFTLRVTDYASATATKTLTWNVSPLSFQYGNLPVSWGVPTVIPNPLRYNQAYTQPLLVLGGTGDYPTWTNLSAMPSGLALAAGTGVVSGTPTGTGGFSTSVRVTDTNGIAITSNINFNVAGPTATTLSFPSGPNLGPIFMGSSSSTNITPSGPGAIPPYTVTAVTPLPPGFSIVAASDGVVGGPTTQYSLSLMGIATSPGTFTFTLEALDSAPVPIFGARTYTLTVLPFSPFMNSVLSDASVGTPFSQPLLVFDITGTATWTMAVGSVLPPGLSLVSGNLISGTPTQAGAYSFALIVSDASGLTFQRTFTLNVSPIRINGNDILPAVTTGTPYSYTFSASGGSGSPTWSLATGYTLPAGLTLSTSGLLSGTRTSGSGNVSFIVTATDGTSSVSRRFLLPTLLPNPNVLSVALSGTLLNDATVGQSVSYVVSNSVSGGVPPYGFSVAPGSTLPPGLQLLSGPGLTGYNPGTTVLGGIPSLANQYVFDLIATDAAGAQARRTFRLNVAPFGLLGGTSITILTGASQSLQFVGAGGTAPYTFSMTPVSLAQDALPPGLTLSSSGLLSGSTTSSGNYAFRLRVEDGGGRTLTRQYSLTVNTEGGLRVTTVNPGDTWIGSYISRSFATNITGSYTWSVVAGALPPGTSLVRSLAVPPVTSLVGAVTAAGTYTYTLRATDDATGAAADHAFTYRVGTAQIVTPPWALVNILDVPSAQAGTPYAFALKMAGGTPPYTLAPSPFDPLPAGLTLSPDGVLAGTPASMGSYTISMIVTDAAGYSNAISGFTLIVAPAGAPPPLIRSGGIAYAASAGVPYAYGLDIMLRGGTAPFTWSVTPGSSLPAGLTMLQGSNGVSSYIGGTPTTPGTYTFWLTVTDSGGQTLTTFVSMSVSALSIAPNLLPPATVGTPYTQTFVPSGGTGPYTIQTTTTSDMPPGMSFSTEGVLSGTPTHAGIFNVMVRVTDATGIGLTRYFPIFIDNALGEVPALGVSPRQIEVFHDIGAPAPSAVPVTVTTTSGALPASVSVAGIPAASISAVSGTTSFATNLSFNVSSLGAGTYTGLLAASAPGAANLGDYAWVKLTVCAHTVFPLAGSAPDAGGAGTFNVSSGAGCAWTAATSAPWITVTSGAGGTGSGAVSYSLAPNASADARTGTITVNGAVYTVTQFGSACTYTANPAAGSVSNTGGTGAFTVSTNGTCGWAAMSSDAWLTITGGASGTGNATVTYSATPNTTPDLRSATITVNGAMHTVVQFGTACSFAISPTGVTATSAGGMATVSLTASSGLCAWTASSAGLGVTPASGSGTGTLQVAVPTNTLSSSRWLTATIAGQTFSVYQTGVACNVSLSSSSASVSAGANAGSVDVTTLAGCTYDTVLGPSWITVTSGASGVGPDTLVYLVEPNSTTYSRTGTLTIGGQAFQITQAPQACSVTLNTTGLGSPFGVGAATGTIGVTANGANCSWSASSNVSWAAITPSSGTGISSTISVSVLSNAASTVARAGELTIAGQTVNLTQAGTTCTFALESSSGSATASGGTASVRVIAPAACGWTSSTNNASWLTITSSGSAGTSAVQFSAAPNPSAAARSGTLTIAGHTYTVDQAGAPCSFSITGSTTSPLLAADGASNESFGFSATTTGCSPTAVSYSSWITISATAFGGTSGSVTYSAAPNPYGTQRSGTIQVGNALFTVVQTGAACAYSLNAYGKVYRVAGGDDTLLGSPTASGCSPAYGTDQPSFITLGTLTGPVLNNFSLPYQVSPFTTSLTAVVRIGRVTFGGQTLTIKQLSW